MRPAVCPAQRAFDVAARFAFSLHSPPDSSVAELAAWGPFRYFSTPQREHAQ
jgi:hypothetical protein